VAAAPIYRRVVAGFNGLVRAEDGLALAIELATLTGARLELTLTDEPPVLTEERCLVVLGSHRATPHDRIGVGGLGERLLYGGSCSVAIAPSGFSSRPSLLITRVGLYRSNGHKEDFAQEVARRLTAAAGGGLQTFHPPGDEPDAIEDPAGIEVDLLIIDSATYAPVRHVMLDERAEWVIGQVRCPVLVTPREPWP
jgi:hypothetical protein